jgi:hypothetical protein
MGGGLSYRNGRMERKEVSEVNLATGFVLALNLLQLAATIAYTVRGEWNNMLYWLGAFMINSAVMYRTWA